MMCCALIQGGAAREEGIAQGGGFGSKGTHIAPGSSPTPRQGLLVKGLGAFIDSSRGASTPVLSSYTRTHMPLVACVIGFPPGKYSGARSCGKRYGLAAPHAKGNRTAADQTAAPRWARQAAPDGKTEGGASLGAAALRRPRHYVV